MPLPALLLLLATLMPLLSFGVLVAIGRRMGKPIAGYFATLAIGGSFACSLAAMMVWLATGGADSGAPWGYGLQPIHLSISWLPIGGGAGQEHASWLDVGIYIDSVTIVMFLTISGLAALVHLYAIGWMREDVHFARFFIGVSLACFGMLGLVLGSSLIHQLAFLELISVSSFLLIAHRFERPAAGSAAMKMFLMCRIGEVGFLIGLGLLLQHVGTASLPALWTLLGTAGSGTAVLLPGGGVISNASLSVIGVALFFGAIGTSASFPLHSWLADTTEAPTPATTLFSAITMILAGVYLVARLFPILTPDAKLFIAIIGCISLAMGTLMACVQRDIKQVLTFVTLSQVGLIMLAIGMGSWVGGVYHLIGYAFFTTLLFLAAGSVIHATQGRWQLSRLGGLFGRMPVTAITFFVAILAISGFGFGGLGFAGFTSHNLMLQHAAAFALLSDDSSHLRFNGYWLLFWLPVIAAYLTPFALMRCWMLTFWGSPREEVPQSNTRERPILWTPLIVLAIASIIGGHLLLVREFIENGRVEITHLVKSDVFATAWKPVGGKPNAGAADDRAEDPVPLATKIAPTVHRKHTAATSMDSAEHDAARVDQLLLAGQRHAHTALAGGVAGLIGLAIAFLMYVRGNRVVALLLLRIPPLRWVNFWLGERMFFDDLYSTLFVGVTRGAATAAAAVDRHLFDGFVHCSTTVIRGMSSISAAIDHYLVDGAVDGMLLLAHDVGAVARAPLAKRNRIALIVLMTCLALIAAALAARFYR